MTDKPDDTLDTLISLRHHAGERLIALREGEDELLTLSHSLRDAKAEVERLRALLAKAHYVTFWAIKGFEAVTDCDYTRVENCERMVRKLREEFVAADIPSNNDRTGR